MKRGGYIPYGRDGHTATRGKGQGGTGSTELSPASQAALAGAMDKINRAGLNRCPACGETHGQPCAASPCPNRPVGGRRG